MKKIILFSIFVLLLLPASAQVNLNFILDIEDKRYYPNEEIDVDVEVKNLDTAFTAKDAKLRIEIADRFYEFEIGDLEADEKFTDTITLPEFPPGTHNIKGILKYTGMFEERFTEVTYNSFEVAFPPIERYPRNVNVIEFNLPDELIAGKTYDVSVTVKNEGNVGGDMLIEVASLDEFYDKETHLDPGETETIDMTINFKNTEVSLIEARVYAIINDIKYLLVYSGKRTYTEPERVAKLSLDKVALVGESDGKINQNDETNLKIYIKNTGNYPASDVKATLSSDNSTIEIVNLVVDYTLIANGESYAPEDSFFRIKTVDAEVKKYPLKLDVSYTDSKKKSVSFDFNIEISEGDDECTTDNDCDSDSVCTDKKCTKLDCDCGYAENHKCIDYECCSDADCNNGLMCLQEEHYCGIPSDLEVDVLIVTIGSKLEKTKSFRESLGDYQETLKSDGLSSFYIELDSLAVEKIFNVQLPDPSNWKQVKQVTDKLLIKTGAEYLLILGGVGVMPQPFAKTAAEIPTIPVSDDRYADLDLDGLPDVAVGRMPNPSGEDSEIIDAALQNAVKMHKKKSYSKTIIADICIFPPSCWGIEDVDKISKVFFGEKCLSSEDCYPVPPYCDGLTCSEKEVFWQKLANSDILSLDAHGSPFSFAASTNDGWYTVLSSDKLYKKPFNTNPLFVTMACHSGTIDCEEYGCIKRRGSVFSFLANGASVYIGSTRYGYGGITASLMEETFNNLKQGDTIGQSHMKMKRNRLEKSYSDWTNAVIYELALYGDPTLKVKI